MVSARSAWFLALVVLLPLALAALNALLLRSDPPPRSGPLGYMRGRTGPTVSAHRGSRYLNPENTVRAHAAAAKLGAHVLEFDVRRSRDGHLVVFHDPDNARVVGDASRVASVEDSTLAEVRAWDAAGTYSHDGGATRPLRGSGVAVPTLHEFLLAFQDASLNIEIKEDDPRVVDLMLAELALWPGIERRVVVGSRYCAVIRYFRRAVGASFATSACEDEGIHFVLLATAGLAVPYYRLVAPPAFKALQIPTQSGAFPLATRSVVELAHALGVEVHYWVVNDEATMRHCLDIGADVLITDRPDLAVPLVAAPGPGVDRDAAEFYVPAATPPEVHGCVTLVCAAIQQVNAYTLWLAYAALVGAVVSLCGCCCCRGAAKNSKEKNA